MIEEILVWYFGILVTILSLALFVAMPFVVIDVYNDRGICVSLLFGFIFLNVYLLLGVVLYEVWSFLI